MKSLMIRDYDTLSYINELYNTNMITQDEILLNNFGIDIYSLDPKRKHCIINCVSNIKTKKQFKHISDLYF